MKASVRSVHIPCKCSCPEFLAASGRYELKVKLAVVLGSRISSSFAQLKSRHEHVANAVTVGIKGPLSR